MESIRPIPEPGSGVTSSPPPVSSMNSGFRPGFRGPLLVFLATAPLTFLAALQVTATPAYVLLFVAGGLGAHLEEVAWLPVAYLAGYGAGGLLAAASVRWLGAERCFAVCLAVFALGAALCGLCNGVWWLVAFCGIEGLGGGGGLITALLLWFGAFSRPRPLLALLLYGLPFLAALAAGPSLGRFISENYSWRWLFLGPFFAAAVALVPTALLLRRSHPSVTAPSAPAAPR